MKGAERDASILDELRPTTARDEESSITPIDGMVGALLLVPEACNSKRAPQD